MYWYALSLCSLSALFGDAFFSMVLKGSISSDGIDDGWLETDGAVDGDEVGNDEGVAEGFYIK